MSFAVSRQRALFVVLALLAFVGLSAAMSLRSTANASPYPPTSGCTLSTGTASVGAGDTVAITGTGFPADTSVALTVHSVTESLGSVRTDSSGDFTTSVTIPSNITGSGHHIEAAAGSMTCSFDPFGTDSTTTHRSSTGTDSASTGSTASTGFAAITATLIAVALLGGGLLLLLVSRRRSNQS